MSLICFCRPHQDRTTSLQPLTVPPCIGPREPTISSLLSPPLTTANYPVSTSTLFGCRPRPRPIIKRERTHKAQEQENPDFDTAVRVPNTPTSQFRAWNALSNSLRVVAPSGNAGSSGGARNDQHECPSGCEVRRGRAHRVGRREHVHDNGEVLPVSTFT